LDPFLIDVIEQASQRAIERLEAELPNLGSSRDSMETVSDLRAEFRAFPDGEAMSEKLSQALEQAASGTPVVRRFLQLFIEEAAKLMPRIG
jgi:hypothetical protein